MEEYFRFWLLSALSFCSLLYSALAEPCHYGPKTVMKASVTIMSFKDEYKHAHEPKLIGNIMFYQRDEHSPVRAEGTVKGLKAGYHGFHIHVYGDLTEGCESTGEHYNPYKKPHGPPESPYRHLGDLGNIHADYYGIAKVGFIDKLLTLNGPNSIVGRAVVVHAYPDDLGEGGNAESLVTGNAGERIGCGVIGIAYETQQYPCPDYKQPHGAKKA